MKKVGQRKFIALVLSAEIFAYMDAVEKDETITV